MELSSYEQARAANISRNKEFLLNLGLNEVKPKALPKPTKASKKGASSIFKTSAAPTRRSSRVTMEKVKADLAEAKENNNDELIAKLENDLSEMEAKKLSATGSYSEGIIEDSAPYARLDPSPLSMLNPYNSGGNAEFGKPLVSLLEECFSSDTVSATKQSPKKKIKTEVFNYDSIAADEYGNRLAGLTMNEEDVAKLTEDRITATLILPFQSKLIVMAGDKVGNVGIWDVDNHSNGGVDGVYKYRPHVGNIASFHCNQNSLLDNRVYSCSYDGTVRYINMNDSSFHLAFQCPEDLNDIYCSDVSFSHVSDNIIFLGRNDGKVGIVDLRGRVAGGVFSSYQNLVQLHEYKINSVQLHPQNENYLITASSTKDGFVSVHDLRKLSTRNGVAKSVIDINEHSYSINSAIVSPNGQYLVSVAQDSTIKVFDNFMSVLDTKPSISSPHIIRHDNKTGRWLSTFRPIFDPKRCSGNDASFMMGSMDQPRRLEIFKIVDKPSGKSNFSVEKINLFSDYLGSVCSRNSFHPSLNIVAGGNSSGRVHVFKESIK